MEILKYHFNWKTLGETTINVGLITGGQAVNALAEKATASIAIRNTYPAKEVLETVKKLVNKRVEIGDVGMNDPVILTSKKSLQILSGHSGAQLHRPRSKIFVFMTHPPPPQFGDLFFF